MIPNHLQREQAPFSVTTSIVTCWVDQVNFGATEGPGASLPIPLPLAVVLTLCIITAFRQHRGRRGVGAYGEGVSVFCSNPVARLSLRESWLSSLCLVLLILSVQGHQNVTLSCMM
jgi:hypothetical protein